MNGRYVSMPYGMVFKKYYCSKCGAILEKEKVHRVVTKDDKDYYQYHDRGTFPRRDYDVYSYRFMCPCCEARISFEEQCIIEHIQKRQGRYIISSSEIKESYEESKQAYNKKAFLRNILFSIGIISFFAILFILSIRDELSDNILPLSIIFAACILTAVLTSIKKYRGSGKMRFIRSYPYETEEQLKRLHAYSSHNRDMVLNSVKCHCFYCQSTFNSAEIVSYVDEGKTAVCPRCGIDSVIPDGINESVNEGILNEMHEYWF